MKQLKSLLTPEQVKNFIRDRFLDEKLELTLFTIVPHEVVHDGAIRTHVTCGTYNIVAPNGFGGLERQGQGSCTYDHKTNIITDTTNSKPTSRRFTEITEVIISVSNINSIARSHEIDPEEVLDIYTDYIVDDIQWYERHK